MSTRKHDPDAAIGWALLVAVMATILLLMVWLTGCTHVVDCPPVEVPDEVLLPIPTPCKKLPVVAIPRRESGAWSPDQIEADVAGYLSAVARDYLRLYDVAVYLGFVIDGHNEACMSADTGHTEVEP